MRYKRFLLQRACYYTVFALAASLLAACVSEGDDSTTEDLGVAAQGEICTGTTCGAILTYLDGVPARSNGDNMGSGDDCDPGGYTYGRRWQCVEYARRYLCKKHLVGTTGCYMLPTVTNACDICDIQDPHLTIRYPYDGYFPTHGDLYVEPCNDSNDHIGHVAVIDTVSGGHPNWTLGVVEQNKSCTGRASYLFGSARCIVHWHP